MPTFTTVALDSFFEQRLEDSVKSSLLEAKNGRTDSNPSLNSRDGAPKHLYISPALYVTPVQAPVPQPCSTDPPSPYPYVVNHKRRGGGRGGKNIERSEVEDVPSGDSGSDLCEEVDANFAIDSKIESRDDESEDEEGHEIKRWDVMKVGDEDDTNENRGEQIDSKSFVSAQGEFFDAIDDFSDGSVSNTPTQGSRIESELHATRLLLLQEIEKRKNAEENLVMIQSQWEQIRSLMWQTGLTLPKPVCGSMLLDNISIDQFSQEFLVSKFVAEAVGRGEARAEAEEAAGAIIESKDLEILRLRDRLQYYETVNHEMSQRNFVEIARRQQERKRGRRKWLWSFTGLSIATGVSLVAYSCFPQSSNSLLQLKPGEAIDAILRQS